MLTFLLLTGCGGDLSGFLPTVKFSHFNVSDLDFEHIDTDFVFTVDNPNPVGAPLDRFQYDLSLMEVSIISGDDPNGLELVADGESEVALPVSLDFSNIYDAITATRGEDDVGFGLAGAFGFDTDIGPIDITYDEAGDFPALRTPKFQIGKLKMKNLGSSSVDFGLDVDVDNDHGSTLGFTDMGLTIKFAGVQVGNGSIAQVGDVEGATTKTLELPFSIDYADAIDAIAALASGEKLKVDLDADVTVSTPFGPVPLHIDEGGNVEVSQ